MRTWRFVAVSLVLVLAVSMFTDHARALRSCEAAVKGDGALVGDLQKLDGAREAATTFSDWRFNWDNVTVNDRTSDPNVIAYVVPMTPKTTSKATDSVGNAKALVLYYHKQLKQHKVFVFDANGSKDGDASRLALRLLAPSGDLVSGANYVNGEFDSLIEQPRQPRSTPVAYTTNVGYWQCVGKCIQNAWPSLPYLSRLACEGSCMALLGGAVTIVTAGICFGCLAGTVAFCAWRCA